MAANSLPLLVLGGLLIMRSLRDFLRITILVTLLSGLEYGSSAAAGVSTSAPSGLVLGYFGCILALAYLERTPAALLLAAVVVLIYGDCSGVCCHRAKASPGNITCADC